MSKEKQSADLGEDLMDSQANVAESTEEKASKVRKEQTPEEKEVLTAGVEKLMEIGVSEKLAKVLVLVPEWNGDKENLSTVKDSVIKEFGGSENLKDYIDGEFQEDVKAFQGIAKAMPVLNNIKSFYARRENSGKGKSKTVQIAIAGVIYNVDATYAQETQSLPAAERKQLLLAHSGTTKANVVEEII